MKIRRLNSKNGKGQNAVGSMQKLKKGNKIRETTRANRDASSLAGGAMIKKVILYSDSKDPYCVEIEKVLRGFDIILTVHDMRTNPLNVNQLSSLLKHYDVEHFLNGSALTGKGKKTPDFSSASRQEILELIAEDNSLLRKPIIVSGRLITFGYDPRTILNMLQIKSPDSQPELQAESAA